MDFPPKGMGGFVIVVVTGVQHYSALLVGPCHQTVNRTGLPKQLILMRLHRHGCQDPTDALLCDHCMCPLSAGANNALTVGVVFVTFRHLPLCLQGEGVMRTANCLSLVVEVLRIDKGRCNTIPVAVDSSEL